MAAPGAASQIEETLRSIYGDDDKDLLSQRQRYDQALQAFRSRAGHGRVTVVRAPGRINLIGEHTDYNHGYVLPIALNRDIVLAVRGRSDRLLRLWNAEHDRFPPQEFMIGDSIAPGPPGDWGNYVKAAAQALFAHRQGQICGMDVLVSGAAPWGTPRAVGLSSSSALLVGSALALCTLNGITLPPSDFARLCSEAEWYVGTRGGIMDHFISVLGQRGHALLLDCRPQVDGRTGASRYEMTHVRMPAAYRVIICNSGVQREKTRSQFNVRVAECRLAVAMLKPMYAHITHLRDVSASGLHLPRSDVMAIVQSLPEHVRMDEIAREPGLAATLQAFDARFPPDQVFMIRSRARHVVGENERVLAAAAALRSGQAREFGCLMNAAHESMSRDYDASCPEVDALAHVARTQPGVAGARVTGAGWGGCVVALAELSDLGFERAVAEQYGRATGLKTDIFTCTSGPGASVVGVF